MPSDDARYPAYKRKWPKVLAFDTSGPYVAIGTTTQSYSGGVIHDIPKAQGEHLVPLIEDWLGQANWAWGDLDVIGVVTGPGNFTGVRIAVSAARGLALGLKIPLFGVSNFLLAGGQHGRRRLISLPAPQGLAFVQGFNGSETASQARLIDPTAPPRDLNLSFGTEVYGHRAEEIGRKVDAVGYDETFAPNPERLAEQTEQLYLNAQGWPERPAPLYIRPADAAPSRHQAPKIIG